MLALVVLESVALGLLGLLVAGLLRSHAEILRQLHHLGGGLELSGAGAVRRPTVMAGPPAAAAGATVGAVVGESPHGDAVSVALDRPGQRVLLLFLSSGCGTCAPWWEGLRAGDHARALPGVRTVVVARDRAEESPSLLAGLASADVSVVLASAAWDGFDVPGSPYAVLVDGSSAAVIGQGVAHSWAQLGSLVAQHLDDLEFTGGPEGAARRRGEAGGERGEAGRQQGDRRAERGEAEGERGERRADAELMAAGIHPGHPSLHPEPGSWTGAGSST
ncbi:MAG TPA: hypothetical protein VGI06_08745 [Acidimicrobiales bacterium]